MSEQAYEEWLKAVQALPPFPFGRHFVDGEGRYVITDLPSEEEYQRQREEWLKAVRALPPRPGKAKTTTEQSS